MVELLLHDLVALEQLEVALLPEWLLVPLVVLLCQAGVLVEDPGQLLGELLEPRLVGTGTAPCSPRGVTWHRSTPPPSRPPGAPR